MTKEIQNAESTSGLMRRLSRLDAISSIAALSAEMMTEMQKGAIYADLAHFDAARRGAHNVMEMASRLRDGSRTKTDREFLMRLMEIFGECDKVIREIQGVSTEMLEARARQDALNGMGRDTIARLTESLRKISSEIEGQRLAEIENRRVAGSRRIMVTILAALGAALLISVIGGTMIYRGSRAAGRPVLSGGTWGLAERAIVDQTVNQLLTVISETLAEAARRKR